MQRKPNIKWRKSDAEKLEAEIKRFNAKIYRNKRAHPELESVLPKPILKADKVKMIDELKQLPRSEFNKELNSLNRFSKKGSEKIITSKTGNSVTLWEKNEVSLKVANINRERTKERKKIENMDATSQGEKLGMKRGEMGSERLNELKPKKFNFDKIRGGVEWEKFKASVKKQSNPIERDKRIEQYKENYLKALDEFGGYADHIKALVEQLPADVVVKTYYSEQEAIIKFVYEGIDGTQEKENVLETLEKIWSNTLKDYKEFGYTN